MLSTSQRVIVFSLRLLAIIIIMVMASAAAAETVVPCETVRQWPDQAGFELLLQIREESILQALEELQRAHEQCQQDHAQNASIARDVHSSILALNGIHERLNAQIPRQAQQIRRHCRQFHVLTLADLDEMRSPGGNQPIDGAIERLRPRLEVFYRLCTLPAEDDDTRAWAKKLREWKETPLTEVIDDQTRMELVVLTRGQPSYGDARRYLNRIRRQVRHHAELGVLDTEQARVYDADLDGCEARLFSFGRDLSGHDQWAALSDELRKCLNQVESSLDMVTAPLGRIRQIHAAWYLALLALMGIVWRLGKMLFRGREDKLALVATIGEFHDRLDFALQRLDAMRARIEQSPDTNDKDLLSRCDGIVEIGRDSVARAEAQLRPAGWLTGGWRKALENLSEKSHPAAEQILQFEGTLRDLLDELEEMLGRLGQGSR